MSRKTLRPSTGPSRKWEAISAISIFVFGLLKTARKPSESVHVSATTILKRLLRSAVAISCPPMRLESAITAVIIDGRLMENSMFYPVVASGLRLVDV